MSSSTVEALRLLRRECVRAYAEAFREYVQIEERLGEVRERHRDRTPLTAPERELLETLPDRGIRHGITLTRAASALDQLQGDTDALGESGEAHEIGEELALMRRPVRLLADLYVLMIVVESAEDVFGLPYVDSQLLPEYA